jgi:putative nucleotidyltransferase with HDIG domain
LEFSDKTILIVDDDTDLRTTLVAIAENLGFTVTEASDGQVAKSLIALNKPDIVLSDIKMPILNGIELLHFVKKNFPTKFVLMTGFSEIMETQEGFKIGADSFLSKPFTQKELLEVLRPLFADSASGKKAELTEDIRAQYCRVPIDDFTAGSKLKVDIYLKLADDKFLKIAKQSAELSSERLQSYKAKGLSFFYIKREEFAHYVGLNIQVSRLVSSEEKFSSQKKFGVLKHTAEVILQESYVNGINKEKFLEAKDIVQQALDVMSIDHDLVSLLDALNSNSDHLYTHSVGVSLYSSLIAEEIGWTGTLTKFKVSMGALLHDIGKKELDSILLETPRRDFNRLQLKAYESHTSRGRDILDQIQSIPSDIALIALQHHENCLGRGYPGGLSKDQIHPLAKLISVANRFCELVLKGPGWVPISPLDAITKMVELNSEEYDPTYLIGLMNLFKHPLTATFIKNLNAGSSTSWVGGSVPRKAK